jgi:hypothetical protein
MITRCTDRRGFTLMLIGFLLTVGVRVMIGEAHAPGI